MEERVRLHHSCLCLQTLLELQKLLPAAPLGPALELSGWAWGSGESACSDRTSRGPGTIRGCWLQNRLTSPSAPMQTLLALPVSGLDRCPSPLGPSALQAAISPLEPTSSACTSSSPPSPQPRRGVVVGRTASLFSFQRLAADSHPTLLQATPNRLEPDWTGPDQPTADRSLPVQMFLQGPSVPLVSQEVRQALESHLRRKRSQRLWGFPCVLHECLEQLLRAGEEGGPGSTGDGRAGSREGSLRCKMAAGPGQTGPGQTEPGQTEPVQSEPVRKQVTLVRRKKLEMKFRIRNLEVILGQLPRRVVQSHQATLATSARQPVTSRPRPPLLRRKEVTSVTSPRNF
ncbi:uncharacterized protein [Osmerus mordax]|uniref:uncharacterized protein n=1 Tax=Osmerus mordax TaxID=8014 RepID=UPI00350FD2A2